MSIMVIEYNLVMHLNMLVYHNTNYELVMLLDIQIFKLNIKFVKYALNNSLILFKCSLNGNTA